MKNPLRQQVMRMLAADSGGQTATLFVRIPQSVDDEIERIALETKTDKSKVARAALVAAFGVGEGVIQTA